jgi:hypothetical protein
MQEQKNEQQTPEVAQRKPNRKERRTAASLTRKALRAIKKGKIK